MFKFEINQKTPPHVGRSSKTGYHSVEFSVNGLYFLYQFKIHHPTESSLGVRIRENSEILGSLKVGDVIRMKYYPEDALSPGELMDTKISYITKEKQGRFQGHYLVGLSLPHRDAQEALH